MGSLSTPSFSSRLGQEEFRIYGLGFRATLAMDLVKQACMGFGDAASFTEGIPGVSVGCILLKVTECLG